MKKIEKDKKEKQKNTPILILLLILILLSILGITLSIYKSRVNGKVFAQIANPVFEVRKEESLLLTAVAPKASYTFEVRNYDDKNINEVDMEYYIEIVSNTDQSINFELFNGESKIPLINNKTNKIAINKENKEEHKYRLDITYDKNRDKNSLNTKSVERRKNEKMQNLLFNYIIYYTFYIFDIFI